MFEYCVRALHLSEAAAYKRIATARAARTYPQMMIGGLAGGAAGLGGAGSNKLGSVGASGLALSSTLSPAKSSGRCLLASGPRPLALDLGRVA
jgi:hypothetical protein